MLSLPELKISASTVSTLNGVAAFSINPARIFPIEI